MAGGSPGSPGPGGTHARGICPNCYRKVAGGVDHDTGRVKLRRHKVGKGGGWCSDRVEALTDLDIAIRFIWGKPVPGTPEPAAALLEYARRIYGPGPAHGQGTGCPACGSDDYDTEVGEDGQPDYEHGTKTCQECGEVWT
jgi:hypothetical protein